MQQIKTAARPFLGSRAFYASALSIMVPVTIQQLINNLFNMADSLMVGSLDIHGLAMSAVTVANKPYIVFFGVIFGMSGAGGLMLSQYFGANDQRTCQGLFSLQMVLGLVNALVFASALYLFPEWFIQLFVKDERMVALGVRYLRIVCFSYVPVAVSSACVFSMRSLGLNKVSMTVSLVTMGLNVTANYALILGRLGFPALGVEGAAIGTVAARCFEMLFYLFLLARKRLIFTPDVLAFRRLKAGVARTFARKALPLVVNELLWTVGLNIFFWCYARLNEAAVPAVTIAEQCWQIAAVMAMGTSSAVSVLIGTELGANELRKAREHCKKLLLLVVAVSGVCTLVTILLGFTLPSAFALTDELRAMATRITCVLAVFTPFNFVYAFCFFCLRAGGDTRNAALLDSGYMWAVPVPASIIMALLFPKLPVIAAALVVQFLMNAKVVIALRVLRQGKWVRNITITGAGGS